MRPITSFDPSRVDQPHRRRGAGLRRLRRARPQGDPAQRPLHPVRARRRARGDGPGRPAGAARGRDGRETGIAHRLGLGGTGTLIEQIAIQRHTRPRPRRARSSSPWPSPTWPPARSPSRLGAQGPNFATGQRLRHGRPCHRRGDRDDHPRRRGHDGRGRLRGARSSSRSSVPSARCARCRRATTTRGASRPFDEGRDGFVIAEGAGHPRARGARPRPSARRAGAGRAVRLRRDV